jgi:tetratricopeptide (TPR) repeat protein
VTKETAPTQQRLTAKEWLDKGRALAKSGRHQDALQCFDKAHTIDLTDADALVLKGIELNALGRYREALQCFDNTLTTDPKNAFAQESKKVALETIRKTTPQKERAIVSTQVTLKSSTNKFALPSFCPCCGGRPAYTPVKKQTTLSVGSRGMATVTRYLNWSYYVCAQCAVHDKVKKQRGEGRFYAFVPVILFSWGAVNVVFGWSLASNVGAGDIPGLIAGIFVYILIYLLVGRVYNPEKHKTPTCATMGSPVKMDKSRTYTFAREDYGTEFARLNQESVNDKRTRYKS